MAALKAPSEFGLDGDMPALIKPGVYDFKFLHYETKMYFGRAPKIVLWFSICTMGEYFGAVTLPRYYNVSRVIGRPQKYGRFKVGSRSEFLREYATLFGLPPQRLDRIPMSAFENPIIVGMVKTVTRGSNQREIPDVLRYSVISELKQAKR